VGEVDDRMLSQGGAVADAWRHVMEKARRYEAEQASLDSLPLEELRRMTAAALESAADILRTSVLNEELLAHGWNEELKLSLADQCSKLQIKAQMGTYKRNSRDGGLGRWMQEYVSVFSTDVLQDAIHGATSLLRAFSRRCDP